MRIPSTSTSMDRPVNLFRATTACNTFYIFLSAAKAALLPFITLFFRIIGLTAMETGIVMAAKTLTGFLWAPLWARCAVAYNKRRLVLVFSLLMMGSMYLSFTAVYYKVANKQGCQELTNHGQPDGNVSSVTGTDGHLHNNVTTNVSANSVTEHVVANPSAGNRGTTVSTGIQKDKGQETESSAHVTTTSAKPNTSGQDTVSNTLTKTDLPVLKEKTDQLPVVNVPPEKHNTPSPSRSGTGEQEKHALSRADLEKLNQQLQASGYPWNDKALGQLTAADFYKLIKNSRPDVNITEADVRDIMAMLKGTAAEHQHPNSRHTRTLNFTFFNDFRDTVSNLTSSLKEKQLLLFLVVLLIVIFGEFFSSPVEKIADDAWFDFLERIDDMEKYGRQRYWGSLTFALVPIVVTALVDYAPCRMMLDLHHFLLHFFVFGIFMVFTLFLAFYFPMPPPVKQKYSSKVGKGLRVICCDGRGFLFVITLIVGGSVYASFNNFLFWHLQDLGSHEVTMGLCVAIGAFAETPMLVFSNKLVRKLGNAGVVSISLFVLAIRLLYYGFLWTPWAVLPAEITNAFTHTALWYAVLSYDEFNVGSAMDRSIRSILSSMYFGLGFSIGSFLSGVIYHMYGAPVLFWGASVLSATWCLFYSLIQCCLPKKERVKYIKLLRKEDDDTSDGDDDWLEMALKDQ